MKFMQVCKKYGSGIASGAVLLGSAGAANAALDFAGVTTAVDVATVVAAITALAALKVAPGFAKWAYNQVVGWFK
jgi:hypothetical protein